MSLSQLFRERQIIIRSDEGVKYVRLSPLRQKLFAGVSFLSIAALSGWALSTSSVVADLHAHGAAIVQSAYDRIAGRIPYGNRPDGGDDQDDKQNGQNNELAEAWAFHRSHLLAPQL